MLRGRLSEELKQAMKARDPLTVSTLRMVLAALKDRDIAAREKGNQGGIGEAEIIDMMQKLVRQRGDSIEAYAKGGRADLVQQEQAEIAVIERFLPRPMSVEEIGPAVTAVVAELGATTVKDMGRVMARLKEQFAGRMDFAKAGALVKQRLS